MCLLKIEKVVHSRYEEWDKKQTFVWSVVLEKPEFPKVSNLFKYEVVCWCWIQDIKIQEE